MARTALSVQEPSIAGLNPAMTAANVDGHSVPGSGDILIEVSNASGGAVAVTIPTPATVGGLAVADGGGSIPAGQRRIFGPFRADLCNQSDGTVSIDFSAVTSVTCAAYRARI